MSALMFSLSFLFKLTLVYFAPVFLAVMLGDAFRLRGIKRPLRRIIFLGLLVACTIALVVAPFLFHCDSISCLRDQVSSVLQRIFPVHRRIFEDYVANFWIIISPIFNLRRATSETLRICGYVSAIATIGGFLECFWYMMRRPNKETMAISLAATSMSFYLFSWMVHEKAIALPMTALLVGAPVLMKTGDMWIMCRLYEAGVLSLWQLIRIEGSEFGAVGITGFGLVALYALQDAYQGHLTSLKTYLNYSCSLCNALAFIGALLQSFTPSMQSLPFLWVLLTCVGCFGTFVIIWRQLIRIVRTESLHSIAPLHKKSK